jgi:serine/threonine-protein kinase
MAAVWEAEDTLLDRSVAIKLLHAQFADEPEFLERFRREARAAARLSHPNIVPIYDVGEHGDSHTPYIVMELVSGGNLKDRIRQAAPLPDAEIRTVGATLASTLEYAHRKGLIHRDVKPQNVLLGDDGRPRLTDFGIAQAMASSGLTRTGTVMGSVHYISPEQVRGRPAVPQSDIYSLGAVLYEMATGRVPFEGETDLAIALAHAEQTPAAPRTFNPGLAPDLERTILRALSKSPDLRFASASELAEALRGGANGAAGVTRPVPAAEATRRLGPKAMAQPVPTAARRGATAAPATAVPQARRTTRPKARRGASNGLVGLLVAMAAVLIALGAGFYGLATLSREGLVPTDPTPAPTGVPTSAPTAPPKPVVVPTDTAVPPTPTPQPSDTPVPPTPSPSPLPAVPRPSPVAPPTAAGPPPSPPPRGVVVPQLRGRPLDQAQAALAAAGLTLNARGVNANVDKNVVVDQSPAAGATLLPGGTVALQVGTGSTAVPDVSNLPRDQALQQLQANSFRVTTRDRRDARVPAGAAISTNPPAAAVVARGSDIELDISTGR